MKIFAAIFMSALLTACAFSETINRKNAVNYHDWGEQAEFAGDYELAERNYGRALINARLGNSPAAGISMVAYNLGRMKGYLCKYSEAEQLLLEAIALEQEASGSDSGLSIMKQLEIARFYFDYGQYDRAVAYYASGLPGAKKLGVGSSDPVGLADAIDDYARALDQIGRHDQADNAKRESETLRNRHPGQKADFVPIRYNKTCTS